MERCDLRSDCPINFTAELIGDKWSLLIIRDIIFDGKSSYSDFLHSEEKIATNILASRLASLENNGFIQKVASPANKARHTYVPTPMAIDLVPLFIDMVLWSAKYAPDLMPQERKADLRKAKTDREAFIKEVQQRARARIAVLA